jgi:hypothetical protein
MIGFETPIPPLRTSTTVGIELSKLRKSNQRFDFQKFTLMECSRLVTKILMIVKWLVYVNMDSRGRLSLQLL